MLPLLRVGQDPVSGFPVNRCRHPEAELQLLRDLAQRYRTALAGASPSRETDAVVLYFIAPARPDPSRADGSPRSTGVASTPSSERWRSWRRAVASEPNPDRTRPPSDPSPRCPVVRTRTGQAHGETAARTTAPILSLLFATLQCPDGGGRHPPVEDVRSMPPPILREGAGVWGMAMGPVLGDQAAHQKNN